MPGITGAGTTFDLPNFVGDLFTISPTETPLLSAIGGLTGGREASDVQFEWQTFDLRDADENRQRLEGADAPDPSERVRETASNVVEIHQESVGVTYTRQSVGNYATQARGEGIPDELQFQMDQQIAQVARDVDLGFITGQYAKPANNMAPRKTRGLLQAITTNIKDMAGGTPTVDDIVDLFQVGYQNGGFTDSETRTFLCGPAIRRYLTKLFVTDAGLQPLSADVGGAKVQRIVTDFGDANIMLDRNVPDGVLIAVSLDQLAPRFLTVPGKGHFFWEPLAKTGSTDASQLYGEIGLEYGNEAAHAKMVDLTTPYDAVGAAGSGSGS